MLDIYYKSYYSNGSRKIEGNYRRGKRHGYFIFFNLMDRAFSVCNYKRGVKHGACHTYDKNNRWISVSYYKFGRLVFYHNLKRGLVVNCFGILAIRMKFVVKRIYRSFKK